MVWHYLEINHNFNFKDYRMLVNIHNKKNFGKLLNQVLLVNFNVIKQTLGFSNLYQRSMPAAVHCWQKCIASGIAYVEKQ